jgi:hypothetical protein
VLAAVFAVLLAAVPCSASASANATTAATTTPARVLLIGVPDLRWSDVAHMPLLSQVARTSSVANLSVRSSGEATRCGDGLLELSAGTRVPSGVVSCELSFTEIGALARSYRSTTFAPKIGTLGDHVVTQATALDRAAAVMLVWDRGMPVVDPTMPAEPGLTVAVDKHLYGAGDGFRPAAVSELDRAIDQQRQLAGPDAVVIVAGISDDITGPAHLHALIVSGPGWGPGELRSASTGRTGYVQLVDLTATLLGMTTDKALPENVIGRPVQRVADAHRSPAALADDDQHARAAADVSGGTRNTLALILVALLALLLAGRREIWPVARLFAAAPVLTFLVQVAPWWRWGTAAYGGLVAGASVVIGLLTMALDRRHRTAALLAVPAFTALVLVIDQLAGAPLDLSAPMGDNPLVAGRFHGMGNMAFALMAAAALFCAGVLANRAPTRRARLAIVGGIGAVALVVDAFPSLGDDLGGLLALLPAAVLLAALVAGVRVTWRRVALVAGVTLVVAAAVGTIDAVRPADRRTHIGRFVADLANGHLDPVADRKWRAMLHSFRNVALDLLVVMTAAVAVFARRWVPRELAAALIAVATVGVLGTLLNDSGVVVVAGAAFVAVPAVIGDTRKGERVSAGS